MKLKLSKMLFLMSALMTTILSQAITVVNGLMQRLSSSQFGVISQSISHLQAISSTQEKKNSLHSKKM